MFSVSITCLIYLSHVYVYLCSIYHFSCMFSDSHTLIYMYLLDLRFTVISFMLLVIACTCMPEPPHLIMYTCDCLSTPTGFIICTRGLHLTNLDRGLATPDQSGAADALTSGCLSGSSFFQHLLDRLARFSSCYS